MTGGGSMLLNGLPATIARDEKERERARVKAGRAIGRGGAGRVTRRGWGLPERTFVFGYFGDLLFVDYECWHSWMEVLFACICCSG